MSADRFFLDTNILVYTFAKDAPNKRNKARYLIQKALGERSGCLSYQVVQEFLNVAQRKFETPFKAEDLALYLTQVLSPLCEVYASIALYQRALELAQRWQYGFYDSLIIASALAAECDVLYSEDLQHGQQIQSLTIVNPFE